MHSTKESWPLSSLAEHSTENGNRTVASVIDDGFPPSQLSNVVSHHQRAKADRIRSSNYHSQQVPNCRNSRHNQNQTRCRNRHSYHHRPQNGTKENLAEPSLRSCNRRSTQETHAIETSSGGSPSSLSSSSSNQGSLNSTNGDSLLTMVMEHKYKEGDDNDPHYSSAGKQKNSEKVSDQRLLADGRTNWSRPMFQSSVAAIGGGGHSLFSQDDTFCFCPKRPFSKGQAKPDATDCKTSAGLTPEFGDSDEISTQLLGVQHQKLLQSEGDEHRYLAPCATDFRKIDWQEAFGFSRSDDDLGFDPFSESCKALEDLIRQEKEMIHRQRMQVNSELQRQQHRQQQDNVLRLSDGGSSGGGYFQSGWSSHNFGCRPQILSVFLFSTCDIAKHFTVVYLEAPDLSLATDRSFVCNRFNPQATPFVPRQEEERFDLNTWQSEWKAAETPNFNNAKFSSRPTASTSLLNCANGFSCSMKSGSLIPCYSSIFLHDGRRTCEWYKRRLRVLRFRTMVVPRQCTRVIRLISTTLKYRLIRYFCSYLFSVSFPCRANAARCSAVADQRCPSAVQWWQAGHRVARPPLVADRSTSAPRSTGRPFTCQIMFYTSVAY
ncbi:unnamed protein product [Soboliphyme baturini]|uniref:Schwannomin-interacting protein 1 n=1 Tax=Soboliphyme baturini TaxID=241478 RepID=A0A183IWS7_9BILA|nr:unnamed protein product [Soboliphyme baturini]